jgi:hypothetical protein
MALTRVTFVGGPTGAWQVDRIAAVRGEALPAAAAVDRLEGGEFMVRDGASSWVLTGRQGWDVKSLAALGPQPGWDTTKKGASDFCDQLAALARTPFHRAVAAALKAYIAAETRHLGA